MRLHAAAKTQAGQPVHRQTVEQSADASRRSALLKLASVPLLSLASVAWAPSPAFAEGGLALTEYDDGPDSFTILVPSGALEGTAVVISGQSAYL